LLCGYGNYAFVDKNKFEIIKKDEFEKLKREAEIGRSVGCYQLHTLGFRT
jgi:hypothetical protein